MIVDKIYRPRAHFFHTVSFWVSSTTKQHTLQSLWRWQCGPNHRSMLAKAATAVNKSTIASSCTFLISCEWVTSSTFKIFLVLMVHDHKRKKKDYISKLQLFIQKKLTKEKIYILKVLHKHLSCTVILNSVFHIHLLKLFLYTINYTAVLNNPLIWH